MITKTKRAKSNSYMYMYDDDKDGTGAYASPSLHQHHPGQQIAHHGKNIFLSYLLLGRGWSIVIEGKLGEGCPVGDGQGGNCPKIMLMRSYSDSDNNKEEEENKGEEGVDDDDNYDNDDIEL